MAKQRILHKKGQVQEMKYMAENGDVFETEAEARKRDKEIKDEKLRQKQLEDEKQSRKDEIKADYEALLKKVEKYNEDYNEPVEYKIPLKTTANIPAFTFFPPLWDLFDIFRR